MAGGSHLTSGELAAMDKMQKNGNARRIVLRSFKQTVPSKEALGRAAHPSIGFWVENLICWASRRLVAGNLARLQG